GIYAVNNAYRDAVVSGRLSWRPDPRSDVGLSLRFGDDVFHYPTDGAGNIVDTNQRQTTRGLSAGLEAGRFLSPRLEARVTAAYHEDEARFEDGGRATRGQPAVRRARHGAGRGGVADRDGNAAARVRRDGVQGADLLRELRDGVRAREPAARARAVDQLGAGRGAYPDGTGQHRPHLLRPAVPQPRSVLLRAGGS